MIPTPSTDPQRAARALTAWAAALAALLATSALAQDARIVVNPPSLPDSTPFGYSQATVAEPGARIVHVSGQVGYTEAGPNDFRSQVDRAFANLATALNAAGADPASVLKITLLIVDHDEDKLAVVGEMRREMFGDAPPASTLIPVTRLYAPGVTFEIDAVAVAEPAE